ncbi:MAG: short-chain dehydrogenase/reductase SDR [Osedax symbiont Rs2]|nr:MAG: short-chain dehydrogenase/reductase SDR [Osedax symbiont Rs2]
MFNYSAPTQLLKDKTILVTGAGDGIGRAAAITYAQAGATVILLGRTVKKLESVYDEIEALGAPKAAILPLNLETATEQNYIEITNIIDSEFGVLDGLLHNASILGMRTPLENYDPVTWEQVMRVNTHAPFYLTQALLPLLHLSGNASIVFTSSSVGVKGKAYWGAYSVSKFAIQGMMEILADELENTSNVRSNCINPGATRTSMRAAAYPGEQPECNPSPEQIMPVYLYLMGADSSEINGRTFNAQD